MTKDIGVSENFYPYTPRKILRSSGFGVSYRAPWLICRVVQARECDTSWTHSLVGAMTTESSTQPRAAKPYCDNINAKI